jgi:hypothetical protein
MPCFFDSAGVTHAAVGCQRGTLFHFTNIDGNLSGAFTLQDSTFTTFSRMGTYSAPTLADINDDGYIDAVIGVSTGGVSLYLGQDPNTVGVEETIAPSDITIYPNPAQGLVNINNTKAKANEKWDLTLSDLAGRVLVSESYTGQVHQLNISSLPKGMYLLNLNSKNGRVTKRLMVY